MQEVFAESCNSEATNGRALTKASYTSNNAMTLEACTTYCGQQGASYAGAEYAGECCASFSSLDEVFIFSISLWTIHARSHVSRLCGPR